MVLWTASTIAGPLFVRYGIDHGISADSSRGLNEAVVAYVVTAVATYFVYRRLIVVVSQVGEGFLRDLRTRVFDHLQRLSMPFYDREKAGVLVSRMTSDVDSLSELVQMGLVMFAMNTLLLVFSLVVLFVVSWQLALVCMIALPFVVVASIRFQRESNRAYLTIRDRIGHTLSRLQEGISGVRVIQAYGRESTEIERFNGDSRDLYDAHMRSVRAQAWYLPVIEFAGLGTTALVVGIGGWMSIRGVVTIGTIAFFVLTLGNLFDPVQQLSQLFNTVQSAGAGLKKLFELLDTPVEVAERPGAIDLPEQGRIEVDRVSFSYTGTEPVLQDVTLCIETGERLALVGPTGAGKSTLAKIIARLYDPTEGTVRFGGVDLRDATQRSLRERIVVVPQEGFLFNGTIRENVRIARGDATDDEIDEALRAVGIFERFDAPRRARHRGARTWLASVRRREAARVAGPGRPGRPGAARARRGDLQPRPRHRAAGGVGHGPAHGGPHGGGDRPPALDRRARRPGRGGGRRPSGGAGPPCRPAGRRSPLRRAVHHLERRAGRRHTVKPASIWAATMSGGPGRAK